MFGIGEVMKKRIWVIVMLVGLIAGAATISGFGNVEFNDLDKKHWAYPEVNTLIKKKVVSGYPDGSFRPEQKVTYGEFIKMAVTGVAGGEPAHEGGHWANTFHAFAVENQWFSAWDIDKAVLDRPIPRAYMALIAHGIMEKAYEKGCGRERQLPKNYSEIMDSIKDVDATTPYEYAIVSAYSQGILTGYPNKTFRPEETLTRAESAAVIGRLIESCKNPLEGVEIEKDGSREAAEDSGSGLSNGIQAQNNSTDEGMETFIEKLIIAYPDEVWEMFDDNPNHKGPYYIGFKAGDTYRVEEDGGISIIYNYPYSYNDRFNTVYGLGILKNPDTEKEKVRIRTALSLLIPDEAERVYVTFLKAAQKNYQKNEHYMRKEYFGGSPVMMDAGGGMVNICIWPAGSESNSRSWDVAPGEVKEDYYNE